MMTRTITIARCDPPFQGWAISVDDWQAVLAQPASWPLTRYPLYEYKDNRAAQFAKNEWWAYWTPFGRLNVTRWYEVVGNIGWTCYACKCYVYTQEHNCPGLIR